MENRYKTTAVSPEPAPEAEKKPSPKRKKRFSLDRVDQVIRYVVFLAAIGGVYIWNSHYAERQVKKYEQLQRDIKELKSEYATMDAALSYNTRRSVIANIVDTLGLRILTQAPIKIERDEK